MTSHLFVYGTLMRAAADAPMGHDMRARLEASGAWTGPATIPGRLYDLGAYPGLVEPAQPDEIVHGEVFRLADPDTTFLWLDAYESIVPGRPDNEYERIVRPVRLASGGPVPAYVYVYRADIARGRHVVNGRWRPTR